MVVVVEVVAAYVVVEVVAVVDLNVRIMLEEEVEIQWRWW